MATCLRLAALGVVGLTLALWFFGEPNMVAVVKGTEAERAPQSR